MIILIKINSFPMIVSDDSEAEDDKILPKDNLILVGHVDDDSVCMEVYGKLTIISHRE